MKTKELKRFEATVRQNYRDDKTAEQQIAHLDRKLGKGVGAVKERARLAGSPLAR